MKRGTVNYRTGRRLITNGNGDRLKAKGKRGEKTGDEAGLMWNWIHSSL
jgi:hypothetical protein